MKTPHALLPVALVAGLALAACGGSSSGSMAVPPDSSISTVPSASVGASSSLGAGASAGTGGGAVAAGNRRFCDTFTGAKDHFGTEAGPPTAEDLTKIKQYATDLEKSAPAEIKDDAKVLGAYFRLIAARASEGALPSASSDLQGRLANLQSAVINVTTWAATHCNNG